MKCLGEFTLGAERREAAWPALPSQAEKVSFLSEERSRLDD